MMHVSVYSNYFLEPFDDESPQDKTTREEEEKNPGGRIERGCKDILVKLQSGGGVIRRVSGG